MRSLVLVFALLFVSSISVPAWSQSWHRAESEHYVVFAELDEPKIRQVVRDMEAFHQALGQALPSDAKRGRKLQTYLDADAKRITWAVDRALSGWSLAGAEFAGNFSLYNEKELPQYRYSSIQFAQASYYITSGFFRTVPPWFRVGASAALQTSVRADPERYEVENAYLIGVPDMRRPLRSSLNTKHLKEIFTTEQSSHKAGPYARFFARSREVARVLLFDPAYSGKLVAYLNALNEGASLEEAIKELGDLDALQESVAASSSNPNPRIQLFPVSDYPDSAVNVRPMANDEVALVAYRFARLGGKRAKIAAKRLKGITSRYPQSAEAWYEFAAAEYALVRESLFGGTPDFRGFGFSNSQIIVTNDAYSDRIAWEAVNRALDLDPDHAPARVLKAEIQISRLLQAVDEDLAPDFEAVRALLEPLAAEPERYPLAAAVAYQSYLEQEIEPTPQALDRLGRAFVTNRGVNDFRYAYASALARVGQTDSAEILLKAMLSNPEFREAAQAALDQTRSP